MAMPPKPTGRKAIKAWKKDTRHERALKHSQLATLPIRRQERQLLDSVLSSKVSYRGGFSPEKARELQKALRTPKVLPSTEEGIAKDKERREKAVATLERAKARLEKEDMEERLRLEKLVRDRQEKAKASQVD